jgi:RNA polymerase sigma-54 factor
VYEQKLTQKATQSLVLSKQMQQSLKILQMSTLDLKGYVEGELEINPFLEVSSSNEGASLNESPANSNEGNEFNSNSQWQEESYLRYEKNYRHSDTDKDFFENLSNDNESLKEHLFKQLNIIITDPKERLIAAYLTDVLDENGYLSDTLEEIAEQLKIELEDIRNVLNKLYKLEPNGCYATGMKDCLKIQLREAKRLTDALEVVVNNIEYVANGDIKAFCKVTGMEREVLSECMEIIKTLDPKPGRNYGKEGVRIVVPDAYISIDHKGQTKIALNSESLPKMFVNSKYFGNIVEQAKNKDEKRYCTEHVQNANWLIKAIQQRNETIFKVAQEISNHQYEFFLRGISYLKPMTLADIAKKVGVHESTISRISNKILATPMGTYEIKFFFNTALTSSISENMVSATAVKQRIKEIISGETVEKVLSDDEIAKLLNESGTNISRRTIAKYREQLKIPPSNLRKRLKSVANF